MASTSAARSIARSRSGLLGYRPRSSPAPNWIGLTKMLTTTRSFSRHAASTRLIWPTWRAPIVGTSPIEQPSARHPRAMSRMNAGVAIAIGVLAAGAVLDLVHLAGRAGGRPVGSNGGCRGVRMLGAGERAVADLLDVSLGGPCDLVGQVGVSLHELRRLAGREAEHVVEHEHLPIGRGTGPDADGRDAHRLGHVGRQVRGHALQDDAERAGLLQLPGVRQDARGLLLALALNF